MKPITVTKDKPKTPKDTKVVKPMVSTKPPKEVQMTMATPKKMSVAKC